jgi:hypothetical protein
MAHEELADDRFFWMAFASKGGRAGESIGSALRLNRLKIIHSRYKVCYKSHIIRLSHRVAFLAWSRRFNNQKGDCRDQ